MLNNDQDKDFLLNGAKHGFRIINEGSTLQPAFTHNYLSATSTFRKQAEAQILEEIFQGHYKLAGIQPDIVSAIGAIPKKDSDEVRLIHDCSRPVGSSLNSHATIEKQKFQTLDEATQLISPRAYMAKVDLKSAYRSVPIHPSNINATGLAWKFSNSSHLTFMYDTRLPFGARKAPSIFHRLTQAVRWEMSQRGFNAVIAYLDDFLIIANMRSAGQHWRRY